jgi:glycosyltransferase involved in cell wall biosynthesis
MNEPLISVIMPVYNAAGFLQESIDSILNQTFTDFELLIIDDGSVDNSREIIRSYTDNRIILIENRHDFIASLNTGLERAKGTYIARMDADDQMHPERFEIQLRYMEEHPDITVCGSWMQMFNDKGAFQTARQYEGYIGNPLLNLLSNCIMFHPTTMMRKAFLIKHNLKYEYYLHAEDYKLWFEVAKKGGVFYTIPQMLLYYRISDGQVSSAHREEQKATSWQIKLEIADYLVSKDMDVNPDIRIFYDGLLAMKNKSLIDSEYVISTIKKILTKVMNKMEINVSDKMFFQTTHSAFHTSMRIDASPLLSVIMPVYNGEKYVSEAIKSIVNQTFVDFEFIIIDDGSTDGTASIIKNIQDPRIIVLTNNCRKGNYYSRNRGLNISNGNYVCVMDADDLSVPERLEKQYRFMEEHLDHVAVGSDIKIFSDSLIPFSIERLRNPSEIKVELLKDNTCTHPSMIIRKDVLQHNKICYNEEYQYSGDYNLLVDLSRFGHITNLPECLLYYRRHPEQISTAKKKEQAMFRNRIQLRQLVLLKVRPSVEEIIIHNCLMNELPMTSSQLELSRRWCNKLILKNHKLKIYDEDCLYNFLKKRFAKAAEFAHFHHSN